MLVNTQYVLSQMVQSFQVIPVKGTRTTKSENIYVKPSEL